MFQVAPDNYDNEKKYFLSIQNQIINMSITIKLLIELSAHFCYAIKVYW